MTQNTFQVNVVMTNCFYFEHSLLTIDILANNCQYNLPLLFFVSYLSLMRIPLLFQTVRFLASVLIRIVCHCTKRFATRLCLYSLVTTLKSHDHKPEIFYKDLSFRVLTSQSLNKCCIFCYSLKLLPLLLHLRTNLFKVDPSHKCLRKKFLNASLVASASVVLRCYRQLQRKTLWPLTFCLIFQRRLHVTLLKPRSERSPCHRLQQFGGASSVINYIDQGPFGVGGPSQPSLAMERWPMNPRP
jgi:hypothetical protein